MELRPYQRDCVQAVEEGWSAFRSQLVVLPTGTGKTIAFAHIANNEVAKGNQVLILAHRDELLEQAQQKLRAAVGIDSALEKGSSSARNSIWPVTVASVQSLHTKRLEQWPRSAFNLIVCDEAHHILSNQYKGIIEHFDSARLLGVTATPDRGDKRSLGQVFETIAYEYSMRKAIQDKFLAPIAAKLIPIKIDLSDVRLSCGDYQINELDARISPHLEQCAKEIAANIGQRKTLVFLPLVRTSEMFAAMLQQNGINAVHIDGASPDRKDILSCFARSEFQVLCNSSLLLEGYDCPDISCVVCLRPTKVRSLYSQIIGRGTRIAPGKENLLILDFLWLSAAHKLCVPASLFAKDANDAAAMMDLVLAGGGEEDLDEVERDMKAEREAALIRRLKEQQRKAARLIDPLQFALSIDDVDLAEYEPVMQWEYTPPTESQLRAIENFGCDPSMVTCKGHASRILETLFDRRKAGMCTVKQAALLRKYGHSANASFQDAKNIIDGIAANGWRRVACHS